MKIIFYDKMYYIFCQRIKKQIHNVKINKWTSQGFNAVLFNNLNSSLQSHTVALLLTCKNISFVYVFT